MTVSAIALVNLGTHPIDLSTQLSLVFNDQTNSNSDELCLLFFIVPDQSAVCLSAEKRPFNCF